MARWISLISVFKRWYTISLRTSSEIQDMQVATSYTLPMVTMTKSYVLLCQSDINEIQDKQECDPVTTS